MRFLRFRVYSDLLFRGGASLLGFQALVLGAEGLTVSVLGLRVEGSLSCTF